MDIIIAIIIALSGLGGGAVIALSGGVKIDNSSRAEVSTIQSLGAVTIVEGGISRAVSWTNEIFTDGRTMAARLEDWQIDRMKIIPLEKGWMAIYPVGEKLVRTNSRSVTNTK